MTLVPYKRELHMGMHGKDVRALQRALRKAGVRHHAVTGEFKRATRRQVTRFQKRHGIRKGRGRVGRNTWRALQPYFDGYDLYLVNHVHVSPPLTTATSRAVKIAWWYYGNRPLGYIQQRAMRGTDPPPNLDSNLDCSEFMYVCIRGAGLPDPSGYSFPNYGNTTSFLEHLQHATGPAFGVLVFYSNPGHVGLCVGMQGGQWMVIEIGSPGGPQLLPYNYRTPVAYRHLT